MREKPILFNAEMVRAILDGRKTVTRRAVKPQPISKLAYVCMGYKHGTWGYPDKESWKYWDDESFRLPVGLPDTEKNKRWTPPYRPGDILYVRETFWQSPNGEYTYKSDYNQAERLTWHPSIHMPREAARIILRVTEVRVERLQDISASDCIAEGIPWEDVTPNIAALPDNPAFDMDAVIASLQDAGEQRLIRDSYGVLWNSTIKPADRALYGWDANPWVWVITFERIPQDGGNSK